MAVINFRCRRCNREFDCDVGKITFPKQSGQRPVFENDLVCPKCGVITIDNVLLTELGQTQLTEVDMEALTEE